MPCKGICELDQRVLIAAEVRRDGQFIRPATVIFGSALRCGARLAWRASRGDAGPRGVRLSPVAAACYMQLKSRGQTLRRGKSRQQDTLSATAPPSERPVVLPTVWETAEAGHWGCVGTHSSWQKARRSTSSGKMLWRDCERVLSLSAKCCLVHLHARAAATTSLRAGKHC